jgi:hypothetical protein
MLKLTVIKSVAIAESEPIPLFSPRLLIPLGNPDRLDRVCPDREGVISVRFSRVVTVKVVFRRVVIVICGKAVGVLMIDPDFEGTFSMLLKLVEVRAIVEYPVTITMLAGRVVDTVVNKLFRAKELVFWAVRARGGH